MISRCFKESFFYVKYLFTDDPYYCGLRARIPNFAKSKSQKEKEANAIYARLPAHQQSALLAAAAHANAAAAAGAPPGHHPHHWQGPGRGYLDNGKENYQTRI